MVSRCFWCCLVGLALVSAARADYSPTYVAYPGWRITSSEDAWMSGRPSGGKRYPLTSLADGDPATAWVFEGVKWDGSPRPDAYRPIANRPFGHGEGQWIQITSLAKGPPVVDAVGIINGYAKDAATYRRNNRITQLRIEPYAWYPPELEQHSTWRPKWRKVIALKESRRMQVVRLPRTRVRQLTLYVERVAAGRDNDLCISEVQLFSKGRPLLARPRGFVLYCPGSECGDGDTLYLVDRKGRRARGLGDLAQEAFAFGFTHDRRLAVVGGYGEGRYRIQALDLQRGLRVYDLALPKDSYGWEWIGGDTMRYRTGFKPARTYEVTFSRPKPTRRLLRTR